MMDNASFRPTPDSVDPTGARRGGRESVIDQDCFFEGTFRTPGNMRVEGACSGVIECQGTLLIAESGRVNARIVAGNLTIAGQMQGEAQCETRFEILKSGRVNGNVGAKSVVVHDGAFFEGDIRMGDGQERSERPAATSHAAVPPSPPAPPAPTAESTPRRRPAVETPALDDAGDSTAAAGDPETPAPKVNGRGQNAGREVIPNRTGEP